MSGALGRAVALSAVIACVALTLPMRAQGVAPSAEVTVRPERATIGDPVTVTARVSAPRGAVIEFPAVVGGGESVEALDPRVVHVRTGGNEVVAEATWRVVAWDTGAHPLPLGDATVTVDGAMVRVPLATLLLTVVSVLPADTAQRTPRAARDIVESPTPWWDAYLPWLVPLLLVAFAVAMWRRNRRDRPAAPVGGPVAERAFTSLASGALANTGESGREVAIATEIVRDYLAARFDGAAISLTTAEVLAMLPLRSPEARQQLTDLLAFADLVKYARRGVSAPEAAAFTERARSVVMQLRASEGEAPVASEVAA